MMSYNPESVRLDGHALLGPNVVLGWDGAHKVAIEGKLWYCRCGGSTYLNPDDTGGIWPARLPSGQMSGPCPLIIRERHQLHLRTVMLARTQKAPQRP